MEPSFSPPLPPLPSTGMDKALVILCHLSLFLGVGFVLPLIVFLVMNTRSPGVGAHAREVLNFHVSLVTYGLVCVPLIFVLIGIPLLVALGLFGSICAIIGAIRASEGGFFRYPLTIRMI